MRRRGAQPGNTNALKHGFYSRQFRNLELTDLDSLEATLSDEVAGCRVAARRIMELSDGISDDPVLAISALNMYGAMCQRVARLMQVHSVLSGNSNDTLAVISQALREIHKELKT